MLDSLGEVLCINLPKQHTTYPCFQSSAILAFHVLVQHYHHSSLEPKEPARYERCGGTVQVPTILQCSC